MSVVKMRYANNTPEEISAELNLEMPDVVRIMQDFCWYNLATGSQAAPGLPPFPKPPRR
ncbi:MAG: hypothetical protein LBQ12_13895 [Deltaproteobacteria bacterium]|jgi:hypothetical protein|nr:hypothetical protein [Deltaproteobacteria bacterium]